MNCSKCNTFPCICVQDLCNCIFIQGTHLRENCNYFLTHFEDGSPVSMYEQYLEGSYG